MSKPVFAYVFERFPTFTQTFCVREVRRMERLGAAPLLFSIRDTRDEEGRMFPEDLVSRVHYLPPGKELSERVKELKRRDRLPQDAVLTLRNWNDRRDKMRVYEAAWIGLRLREAGVRHVHVHFAGIAARAAWWMRRFYGITYSITGHANDIFRGDEFDVGLGRLVADAALMVTVSDYGVRELRRRFPRSAGKIRRAYNGLEMEMFSPGCASMAGGSASPPDRARSAASGTSQGRGGPARRSRSEDAKQVIRPKGSQSLPPARATVGEGVSLTLRQSVERLPPLVLSVGRYIEKKGFDDLIAACGILRDAGEKLRCKIVGEGPLEAELQGRIDALGLREVVELTGPKPMEEIVGLLGESRIFALPCVTEKDGGKDNLPTVIMEAMAARLPVVSTRVAGVPEMVIDGETGFLVEERRPEDFARRMRDLLGDPDRCAAMGLRGEAIAWRRFAIEVTTRRLLRLIVASGHARLVPRLVLRDPLLAGGYLKQGVLRLVRLLNRPKRIREPEDLFPPVKG